MKIKIGHGYDVHRLKPGRKLIIGGVEIPFALGLDGHSDADVLAHAVMDALLGAAGMPDIGCLFPDSAPEYEGADSMELLSSVSDMLCEKGFSVSNIDCTVIAQSPKLAGYIQQMREKIAHAVKIDASDVNVKATTEEKLGFTGEGLGIAAHAVTLIQQ